MTAIAQKGYRGMGMEGSVARWYEKTTRKDLEEYRRVAERLKACLPDGGDVLEVAPGPSFLAIELARDTRFRVTGLDISKTFVELARKNAAEAGVKVEFREGNASEMPFAAIPLYVATTDPENQPYNLVLGRAVVCMEQTQVPGTSGNVILADFSRVLVGMKENRADVSMGIKFLTDEMAFRVVMRVDAQTADARPITPFTGSNQVSPFVCIAQR